MFTIMQCFGLLIIAGVVGVSSLVSLALSKLATGDTKWDALVLAGVGIIPIGICMLLTSVLLKWLIVGRVAPGHHALTAWYRGRLWTIDTLLLCYPMQLAGTSMLDTAVTLPLFMRSLGAKVGQKTFLGYAYFRAGLELVSIGDDVTMGADCMIHTHLMKGMSSTNMMAHACC